MDDPLAITGTSSRPKSVVVVGDWVVDEYNFLVRKHSDISSHTGQQHFRIAASTGSTDAPRALDLCGAGHVAKVLYDLLKVNAKSAFHIHGIGFWNDRDTKLIHHLLHRCEVGKIQPSMSRSMCDKESDEQITLETLDPNCVTNRVARDYLQTPTGFQLLVRRDFEEDVATLDGGQLDNLKNPLPDVRSVAAIVVHDLQRGLVNQKLLQALANKYKNAAWYVRSKDAHFHWPDSIPKAGRRLLLLGPELARKFNPIGHWLPDRLTRPTFEILAGRTYSTCCSPRGGKCSPASGISTWLVLQLSSSK